MGAPFLMTEEDIRYMKLLTDPSIDVLWNDRLACFVIVQELPGRTFETDPDLIGCPGITVPRTKWKALIKMIAPDGRRVQPSPMLVKLALETKSVRADQMGTEFDDVAPEDPNAPIHFDELVARDERFDGPLPHILRDRAITHDRKVMTMPGLRDLRRHSGPGGARSLILPD